MNEAIEELGQGAQRSDEILASLTADHLAWQQGSVETSTGDAAIGQLERGEDHGGELRSK